MNARFTPLAGALLLALAASALSTGALTTSALAADPVNPPVGAQPAAPAAPAAGGATVLPGVVVAPPVQRPGTVPPPMTPDAANAPAMVFAADKGRISYAVGLEMARNFRKNEVEVDLDQILRGMRDGLDGKRAEMGEREFKRVLNNFQNVMRARTMTNAHALAQANRKKGELFLAENRTKPGVQLLPNGVQYKELTHGNGVRPTDRDIVVVQWRGTTLDGNEFDGSETGKPMSIPVAELFNGFHAVVTQMQVGSHWQVWIPAALGYGERGVGSDIGPNATLVLDLELVGVRQRGVDGQ